MLVRRLKAIVRLRRIGERLLPVGWHHAIELSPRFDGVEERLVGCTPSIRHDADRPTLHCCPEG
jgi:hypothetical protein